MVVSVAFMVVIGVTPTTFNQYEPEDQPVFLAVEDNPVAVIKPDAVNAPVDWTHEFVAVPSVNVPVVRVNPLATVIFPPVQVLPEVTNTLAKDPGPVVVMPVADKMPVEGINDNAVATDSA